MDSVTLSSDYQFVIPREMRERLALEPGAKITVIEKSGILYLIPERPPAGYRGVAHGTRASELRDKTERL